MSRIFLSHSSANNAEAIAVRDWLTTQGFDDIFLDLDPARGIKAGERWERALNEAAGRCEAVVFLVSRAWIASGWCRKEMSLAHRLNKRMFGVLIEDLPTDVVPKDLSGEWQLVRLASGRDGIQLSAVLPITHEQETVTFSAEGLRRLKHGLESAGLDTKHFAWPPAHDPDRAPYRGFKALEADDAGIFFGRDGAIITALDALRGLREAAPPRLFVILGASGAGKSSFMRAGLIPRLARDDRHFLPLSVIRPERAVISSEAGFLRALEAACKDAGLQCTRADLRAILADGPDAVIALLKEVVARKTPPALNPGETTTPPTLVIAIDQAEELFNTDGDTEARAFLAILAKLLTSPSPDVIAVFTIRTDVYEPLQSAAGPAAPLAELRPTTFSLPPMAKGVYQSVIEGPARRLTESGRKLDISADLTAQLLADIEKGGAKDALPLLAFTLEQLYVEHRGDGTLTLEKYKALGGIKGAIEAAVAHAFEAADANPAIPRDRNARNKLLRRGLIPWLAGIDPDTSQPRRQVARLSQIPEEARPLIDLLVEARLLATDKDAATGETTVEPAHEALLRQWGLLEGWLEEDFGSLATLGGVKRAATEWDANARRTAWLAHTGTRLEEAERTAALQAFAGYLTAGERDYLREARATETRRIKRERFLNRAMRVAAVVALVGMGVAGWQAWEARKQAQFAERQAAANEKLTAETQLAQSGLLANVAGQLTATDLGKDSGTAMLLAIEGLRDHLSDEPVQRVRQQASETEHQLDSAMRYLRERAVMAGHTASVTSASFSPDGTRVVTASWDKTAHIWTAEGVSLAQLQGHTGPILTAMWSPDGRRIVTAAHDTTARVWSANGALLATLIGHKDSVNSAEWSPDGMRIVTSSNDKTARVWTADGTLVTTLRGHISYVKSAAWSPDGARIVTTSDIGGPRVWMADGALVATIWQNGVNAAMWSPNGRQIVTASADKTAQVFTADGTLVATLKGHTDTVTSAVWSPDGTRIVTASKDKSARIWMANGSAVASMEGHDGQIGVATWSPDGSRIATAFGPSLGYTTTDNKARLWAADGTLLAILEGHIGDVTSAAWSPDGTRIITASGSPPVFGKTDRTARVWMADGGLVVSLRHEHFVNSATWSPDGSRIVTASSDHTSRVWNADGALLATLIGHENSVRSAGWSPDGTRIVTSSWDRTARVWTAAGVPLASLRGHGDWVVSADWSPDGTKFVTASNDHTARVWSSEGALKSTLRGHSSIVNSARWSPDSTRIVTASSDNTARVWNVDGTHSATLHHSRGVNRAAWNPEGTRIVTASNDHTARVWTAQGMLISTLRGHGSTVASANWSPDGMRIVTASWDKTARIWTADGALVATLQGHGRELSDATWSSSVREGETQIATSSSDFSARVWTVFTTSQALVTAAKARAPRCLTLEQRARYFLAPYPPTWCVQRRLWPYHSDSWQGWLPKQRAWLASDRQDDPPPLPKEK